MIDDKPILSPEEDKLNRSRLVSDVVAQIKGVGAASGYVVGLMGSWGYGKSSVLNLVEKELKAAKEFTVIRFNPWMFSGSHELTGQYLAEFSAQLKADNGDAVSGICDKIEEYSGLVAPAASAAGIVLGPWAWLATALPFLVSQRKDQKSRFDQSATAKKSSIEDALRKLGRRIVVMIDDLDRLSNDEIRDVLRLVRLVGDFPDVTYLLAFDRARVEGALAGEGGRAYLDKIIQAPYDLPTIEPGTLRGYFTAQLDAILAVRKHGPFRVEDWQNYFNLGIAPAIQTPRDAKRVSNALEMSLTYVGEEISVADLIGMETIRVLFPAVFQGISSNPRLFAPTSWGFSRSERGRDDVGVQQFAEIIGRASGHTEAVTQLIKRMFPFCQRFTDNMHYDSSSLRSWRKDRKIAASEILDFYLERHFPKSVPSPSTVKRLFEALADEAALGKILESLDGPAIENILDRLEDYTDDFCPESAEPAIRTIFKTADRLRTERTHMGDFGADLSVTRIVLRLLRSKKDPDWCAGVCDRLIDSVHSLSWRLELIEIVGHRESKGHKLVSPEKFEALKVVLRKKIGAARIDDLLQERHLPMLLYFMKEGGTETAPAVDKLLKDDRIFFAVLKASKAQTISQTIGDAAERVKIRLQWRALEHLIGVEALKERVLALEQGSIPDDDGVKSSVALALRYAKGELSPDSRRDDDDD